MPANAIDHRILAGENLQDVVYAFLTGVLAANPPLDLVASQGVTAAAGAGLGTTPPAITFAAGSNALRGRIIFGTGSATPAGGVTATITFPVAIPVSNAATSAFIFLTPGTQAATAFGFSAAPVIVSGTITGITINSAGTLTASQGGTVYSLNWFLIP